MAQAHHKPCHLICEATRCPAPMRSCRTRKGFGAALAPPPGGHTADVQIDSCWSAIARWTFGRFRVIPYLALSANLVNVEPSLVDAGPILVELRPKLVDFGPNLAVSGPSLVDVGQVQAEFGRNRRKLRRLRASLAEFGRHRPDFGPRLPNLTWIRTKSGDFDRICPELGKHRSAFQAPPRSETLFEQHSV